MRRGMIVVSVGAVVAVMPAGTAAADGDATGGGHIDGGTPVAEVEVGVEVGGTTSPVSGGGEERDAGAGNGADASSGTAGVGGGDGADGYVTTPHCQYDPLDLAPGERLLEPDGSDQVPPGPGDWDRYMEICYDASGNEISYSIVFIPPGEPAPDGEAAVDPLVLARRAVERLPLAGPSVAMSPSADRAQLVNLATWLWVDGWAPLSATASVGPVAVTVTATPEQVSWDMGTGDVVVCDGPGMPYDVGRPAEGQSTDCSYTYRRSSSGQPGQRYAVTATQTWDVSWTASGVPGGGDLGEVSRSTELVLRVAEGQALVTGGR